jgi:hypothetical protein
VDASKEVMSMARPIPNDREASPFAPRRRPALATLLRARDVETAIGLANETTFGLAASAWTNDPAERERFVNDLEAGLVFVNAMVVSDPRLPFGGGEALRLRPRAGHPWAAGVRQRQDRVDPDRGRAETVEPDDRMRGVHV